VKAVAVTGPALAAAACGIRVRGDTATAALNDGHAPLHLRKEDGEWRIDAG
jgi:hypothetical protein